MNSSPLGPRYTHKIDLLHRKPAICSLSTVAYHYCVSVPLRDFQKRSIVRTMNEVVSWTFRAVRTRWVKDHGVSKTRRVRVCASPIASCRLYMFALSLANSCNGQVGFESPLELGTLLLSPPQSGLLNGLRSATTATKRKPSKFRILCSARRVLCSNW
jgi:hypothetical protein